MHQERIRIKLPNARQKLQALFPEDNRGDIRIEFGPKSFKLQKAFLRLQSIYFKKAFTANQVTLNIQQKFNPLYFTNVLKCFYGFTVEVLRSEIIQYYPIVKFLEVDSLVKLLREDMINKAEHYDIFMLMQLAHQFDEQEIFEICLSQLQKEQFQQLRYAKLELLRCPMELFKMVIKTHNRMKVEKHRGLPFMEIDQIIRQFCDQKKFNEVQYQELKFELIDKNSLTSQEYKQIFLDDAKRKKNSEYCSMIRLENDQKSSALIKQTPFMSSRLTESLITPNMVSPMVPLINPIQKINDQLTLEMEQTWERKKNEELKAENQFLVKQLQELKDVTVKNRKSFDELKDIVFKLQKQLDDKEKVDKQQGNIIKKLKELCEYLQKQLNDKGDKIKVLQQKVTKLEKMPQKMGEKRMSANSKFLPIEDEPDESRTIQSQIVPGHLLKEFAKPAADAISAPPNNIFKKAKTAPVMAVMQEKIQDQSPDQQSIEQLYTSRLTFDYQPRGCPKKLLPNLANFLTGDGFQKKILNLIYRRNIHNKEAKGESKDLFGRQSLVVLICTRMNQIIGGFTSIEIEKGYKDYIKDDYAFVFNLSKNQKFSIKKNAESEAIFMTPDYLLCFSNDLMISIDPIKSQSQSDWPCAYESGNEKKPSKWLTGEDGAFSIKQIQVYEVKEEAMIMDL